MKTASQVNIFNEPVITKPETEGIKYAGSKLKILPYIIKIVSELEGVNSVLDGFSGSTRVSQAFPQLGYKTTSSDVTLLYEVFATCYLKSKKAMNFIRK